MKHLSSDDATYLFVETHECPMHIGGLTVCDPSEAPNFSFDAVTDLLAARIPELPVMRWRVTGAPLGVNRPWAVEDTELDLDYHVRRIAVPSPGGRKELEQLIGRLIAYPLDRARPLWELWFIEGVEGGRVAMLAKMHHALIDGVSGAGLTELLLDTSPQPRPPAVAVGEPSARNGVPGWERRAVEGIFNLAVMTPYRVARFAQQTVAQQLAVRGLSNKPPRFFEAPHTRFNAEISAQRRVSSIRLPLQRLKVVERAFDVKLNDVVLAIVSGALRRYLQEREGLPERPLITLVPISTRDDSKRGGDEFGNQIATMTVSLATDVNDPGDRIKAIYRSSQGAKEMNKALQGTPGHRSYRDDDTRPGGTGHAGLHGQSSGQRPSRPGQPGGLQHPRPGLPLLRGRRARRAHAAHRAAGRGLRIEHHLLQLQRFDRIRRHHHAADRP